MSVIAITGSCQPYFVFWCLKSSIWKAETWQLSPIRQFVQTAQTYELGDWVLAHFFQFVYVFRFGFVAWAANQSVKLWIEEGLCFGACVYVDMCIAHVHAKVQCLEMKKKRLERKKKEVNINWLGDVCGITLVMIELFHYEQCNFRLQRLFTFLPTGNTLVFSSKKYEGLKSLKKIHTCSTHVPQSKRSVQFSKNETALWILAAIWNVA